MTEITKFILALILVLTGLFGHTAERPHIILIMVDDMGFSDPGFQGGEIETPNLDQLATGGVRFSQFYNSGRCCPTRATLMTGLHPHQTGIGWMTVPPAKPERSKEPPAYQGHLNRECVTIAEVLRENGYATLMTGKWHLGFNDQDDWPLQRGFEKYYGCIAGATNFFQPEGERGMFSGNESVDPVSTTDEAFYTTDAFTDHGIRFLREEFENEAKRPAFLYLAYTAPHWPLQAFEDDIARYRGKYRGGWEKLRQDRYQRQIELGLIDANWPLSPQTPGIPDWESLDEKQQDEMDLKMAVYAAMVDRVDQNIGKLISFLKESGTYENTLIFFLSDNGACQEGGMLGRGEFYDVEKRNKQAANSYGEAWANAGSTPFRYYKHFVHEGGAATPFFMHWPDTIAPMEDWYDEPGQLIDIMPTILDVAGATYPDREDIHGIDGRSLRPSFTGKSIKRQEPIFIEHETNASIREGKWKLVGKEVALLSGTHEEHWELYDMEADRTETVNLVRVHPDKARELAAKWEKWAARVRVYPRGRQSPRLPDPKPLREKPQIGGRAFTVTATVRHPKPNGVVMAQGGNAFGFSLFFAEGKPAFAWRNRSRLTTIEATETTSGKVTLEARITQDKITLLANGKEVAATSIDGLLAEQPGLGLFVGADGVHAVGDYAVPNRFNGRILTHRVSIPLPKVTMRTAEGEKVTPENAWTEYPRPQLKRPNWVNLNGLWDYAITGANTRKMPEKAEGKILVPFAVEAPLSGVERAFTPEDALWYRREFTHEIAEGNRLHLNFEAVDYHCTLWVNGKETGSNRGGNLPFTFDITDALEPGKNEIVLRVTDATDSAYQLHGKQRLNPRGIWYTPVSGIWQTVWLEEVPALSISDILIETENNGKVKLTPVTEGPGHLTAEARARVEVFFDNESIASGEAGGDGSIRLEIPQPKLWSPDSPNLYTFKLELGKDTVTSYFAFRETGVIRDDDGFLRFTLNGKPLFHWGTLDQGWWPDGLLTPPSDEAMVADVEFLKEAGFNTIRKHIKVEPRRYYYHCDRIGMLVWQDQVSAMADNPEWTRLQPNPPTVTWPASAHEQFMYELRGMIDTLDHHPSIVQWVPFNERWGQHQTVEVGEWTVKYDPTRQVNIASGGNFFPSGHIVDAHKYPHPEFPFDQDEGRWDNFVKVMGEFGGHGFPVEGHLWSQNNRNWGYGELPENKEEWLERYRTSIEMLADLKEKGIAAGIYTQTTDVEGEINGLITYDRRVEKVPAEILANILRESGLLE